MLIHVLKQVVLLSIALTLSHYSLFFLSQGSSYQDDWELGLLASSSKPIEHFSDWIKLLIHPTTHPNIVELKAALMNSFNLGFVSFIFLIPLVFIISSFLAKINDTKFQNAVTIFSLFKSVPSFALAPLLTILFSLNWPFLPLSGNEGIAHFILPSIVLVFHGIMLLSPILSLHFRNHYKKEFINYVRAKGASERRIFYIHVLSNSTGVIFNLFSQQWISYLSGSLVIETLFDWPGLGRLTFEAILKRDFVLIEGSLIITIMIYFILNFFSEIAEKQWTTFHKV